MKLFLPLFHFAVLLNLLGCQSQQNDFEQACELANNFDWQQASGLKLYDRFAKQVEKQLPQTAAAQTFMALANFVEQTKGQRYEMVISAAKETGIENYHCEALKKNF